MLKSTKFSIRKSLNLGFLSRHITIARLSIVTIGLLSLPNVSHSKEYNEQLLPVKRIFAEREIRALTKPFAGIATSKGKRTDLFPLTSTGVPTDHIVEAAAVFLSTLSPTQKTRTLFSVDAPEWRRWSNVDNGIYVRQGISLEEMNDVQRSAAWHLLESSLSNDGIDMSKRIMKTDQTLKEINKDEISYGEEKYFFTIMGRPSKTEPWGWQLDGHHLIINYFVLGDQVVVTPLFLGAEPAITSTGKYTDNKVLQNVQNAGLDFFNSLTGPQRNIATINGLKTENNLQAGSGRDNLIIDYTGLPMKDVNSEQQSRLIKLISLYVNNIEEGHARVKMSEVIKHLSETYFSWVGGHDEHAAFYYRIHSPVILIEFDHQLPIGIKTEAPDKPTKQHIHTVVRTPNGNDYGKDLLRSHLENHKH